MPNRRTTESIYLHGEENHITMHYRLLAYTFFAAIAIGHAQQPGLRSPSIKYRQINTDTIRVIYPEGMDMTAQRVAQVTTAEARMRPFTTGAPLRKIDILLQNATDIPNAYVGLGPWRSEFYLTPPQNSFELGSLPWHDILALHEYRHVQQFSAARTGISKLFYYVFGAEAYSGAVHLAVPNWFTEGDAVVAETVLSPQGRGRLPAFTNGYREMVRDREYWMYAKARNGSLKEFIPSHYPLGYLLVNYGREKYGQQFWDSIMIEAAAYQGLFYSFSGAVKRKTGNNMKTFYQNAMDYYHNRWYGPATLVEPTLAGKRYRYQDFSYPAYSEDGTLYTMHTQLDQIPAIYRTVDGISEKVATPGFQTESVFNIGGGKLCWTETRLHPRWYRQDYSVIVVFDPDKRTKRTLTHGSSYFMPALSSDARQIVAVHDNDFQQYALHILSTESGEVLRTLANPDNYFFTYPQWSPDGSAVITAARLPDGRMTILAYDLQDGRMLEYFPPAFAPVGRPCVHGEWVYFTRTQGDVDQIFRLHRSTRYFEQVTRDGTSKYQPTIDPVSGELCFSAYSLYGNKLMCVNLDSADIRLVKKDDISFSDPFIEAGEQNVLSNRYTRTFASSKYPLLSRPVRLHSWSLYADDPVYGVELLSENTLNTIQWRSGWEYNQNSGFHGPFTELVFGLWYPEIVGGYSGTHIDVIQEDQKFVWWQHLTNVGLRIPFYSYSGPYAQYGNVSTRFNHIETSGDVHFQFDYLSHTMQFRNARKLAFQHAESRFSQVISARVVHTLDTTSANQFSIATDFTFPSPIRNHLLWLEFDYRHELTSNMVRFADVFDYSRGYDPVASDDIFRVGINYQFPLVYPDLDIAGLVYFRRIRLNPFFDMMRVDDIFYNSLGVEVIFDVNLFNVEPVSVGVRWAKRLDLDEGNAFSLILPMGF